VFEGYEDDKDDEGYVDDEGYEDDKDDEVPHDEGLLLPVMQRECMYVEAWSRWLSGDIEGCLEELSEILEQFPRDVFVLKIAQVLCFSMGFTRQMLEMVHTPRVATECSDRPYYHGMLAFALEQNDQLVEAEAAAKQAVTVWCTPQP
jgi:hypothetical protein